MNKSIKNKINILHIVNSMGLGGTQKIIQGLVKTNNPNSNHLLILQNSKIIIKTRKIPSLKFPKTNMFNLINNLLQAKSYLNIHKIEIIHCHSMPKSLIFSILLKMLHRETKLIIHEHGAIFKIGKGNILIDNLYVLFMMISKYLTDEYIAISEATKLKLMQRAKINPQKILVIHNFVDSDIYSKKKINQFIKNKLKKSWSMNNSKIKIGFAARIVDMKGWREFLSAAKILNRNDKITFYIAGSGLEEENLKIKLVDIPNVKFLGYIDEIQYFYDLLDIFILPSHWEPMGLTGLEAQAMGCCLVASNIEGLNEVIGQDNAILVSPKSSTQITQAIELLVANPKIRMKLVNEGYANITKYTLIEYMHRLNNIYFDVL